MHWLPRSIFTPQPGPLDGGACCESCGRYTLDPPWCTSCDVLLCDDCIGAQEGWHCEADWERCTVAIDRLASALAEMCSGIAIRFAGDGLGVAA